MAGSLGVLVMHSWNFDAFFNCSNAEKIWEECTRCTRCKKQTEQTSTNWPRRCLGSLHQKRSAFVPVPRSFFSHFPAVVVVAGGIFYFSGVSPWSNVWHPKSHACRGPATRCQSQSSGVHEAVTWRLRSLGSLGSSMKLLSFQPQYYLFFPMREIPKSVSPHAGLRPTWCQVAAGRPQEGAEGAEGAAKDQQSGPMCPWSVYDVYYDVYYAEICGFRSSMTKGWKKSTAVRRPRSQWRTKSWWTTSATPSLIKSVARRTSLVGHREIRTVRIWKDCKRKNWNQCNFQGKPVSSCFLRKHLEHRNLQWMIFIVVALPAWWHRLLIVFDLVLALLLRDVDDDNDHFKSHFSAIFLSLSLSQKCCPKGIPLSKQRTYDPARKLQKRLTQQSETRRATQRCCRRCYK